MQRQHNLLGDLNLLVPLLALLEERHVTRAAHRAGIGQPAMSRVLERSRGVFADELLVRRGSRYERTTRAEALLGELRDVIARLEALIAGDRFDPATSSRRFRIVTTDYAAAIVLPRVAATLARQAPRVRLEIAIWNQSAVAGVADGTYDLALIGLDMTGDLASEPLFTDRFVCFVARDHPLREGPLTVETYAAYPHVVLEIEAGRQFWIDRPMRTLGYERRVAVSTPFMLSAALASAETEAIFTVAKRWYDRFAPFLDGRILEPPPVFEPFRYGMAWHPRETGDAARWLRSVIRDACADRPTSALS